jgi:hypothetical protein
MSFETRSEENNQTYVCTEYNQHHSQCIFTPIPAVIGNTHIFSLASGHSILIQYNPIDGNKEHNSVEMCLVNLDNQLQLNSITPGVCNGVKENVALLDLTRTHNGIAFAVPGGNPMIFAICPLPFAVPAQSIGGALSMHPCASVGDRGFCLQSMMNSGDSPLSLQQVQTCILKLKIEMHGRIFDYGMTQGNLSVSQWNAITQIIFQ